MSSPIAPAITEEEVRQALRQVMDPEMGHDIVTLGLLREIEVEGARVYVHVVPTSAHCPFAAELTRRITSALSPLPGVGAVEVEWGGEGE